MDPDSILRTILAAVLCLPSCRPRVQSFLESADTRPSNHDESLSREKSPRNFAKTIYVCICMCMYVYIYTRTHMYMRALYVDVVRDDARIPSPASSLSTESRRYCVFKRNRREGNDACARTREYELF